MPGRQVSPVSARYCSATGVAHLLERVAAVAEVARAVGDELQLARLDLGAVLGGLEVAQLRAQPVDAAVEAADLGVEAVDEAPQQALALVGELDPVGRDALGQDAECLGHRVGGVVASQTSRLSNSPRSGAAPNRAAFSQTVAVADCSALSKVSISKVMTISLDRFHARGRSPM